MTKDNKAILGSFVMTIVEVILLKLSWNYMMPYLFELPVINYWQAFVLGILCNVLFISCSQSCNLQKIRDKLEEK